MQTSEEHLSATRFYAILDTGYVDPAQLADKAEALLKGGAGILQLRAKGLTTAQREVLLLSLLPLCSQYPDVPLVINDDLELAMNYPGVGLHVGQEDTAVQRARELLGPDRMIGLSTHSLEQAQNAIALREYLSYFAVGPVFPTQTKPDYIPVGLKLVSQVAALEPPLPWFCIGGINRKNIGQVLEAGAKAIVVVSDVLTAKDTAQAVRTLIKAMGSTRS